MEMMNVFDLNDDTITDVCGVVMYVGPLQRDYYASNGMREIAIAARDYEILFLRIFGNKLDLYEEDLKRAEYNASVLEAFNMEVDRASRSLIETKTSRLIFQHCPRFSYRMDGYYVGDDLEDVRKDARRDTSLGDRVKMLVLHRWEQYKDVNDKLCERVELTAKYQTNEQNIEEPSTMIKLNARVTEEPIEEQSTMMKFGTLRTHKWADERSIDDY
ncbi:hypothetical protein ZWY2020_024154 [Hordeum vulgare]|nr:hypothetical protein ZWY2020_024154 [Hordeum vulgare]